MQFVKKSISISLITIFMGSFLTLSAFAGGGKKKMNAFKKSKHVEKYYKKGLYKYKKGYSKKNVKKGVKKYY